MSRSRKPSSFSSRRHKKHTHRPSPSCVSSPSSPAPEPSRLPTIPPTKRKSKSRKHNRSSSSSEPELYPKEKHPPSKDKGKQKHSSGGKRTYADYKQEPDATATLTQNQDSKRYTKTSSSSKSKKPKTTQNKHLQIPKSSRISKHGREHHNKKKNHSHCHHSKKVDTDPRYILLCESLKTATTHLASTLPPQLAVAESSILNDLQNLKIDPQTNKTYETLASSLRNTLLPNRGTVVSFASIKKFQEDCSKWESEVNSLLKDISAQEDVLVELGKEIGVGEEIERSVDEKEVRGFRELISQIKKTGKVWINKMEKMEKQILQTESQENSMMLRAM